MDSQTTSSPAPSATFTTHAPKSRLPATIALHGRVFQSDPIINYLCHTLPASKRQSFIPDFLHVCLKSASINGAQFNEAWSASNPLSDPNSGSGSQDDTAGFPSCSAIWVPPRTPIDSPIPMLLSGFIPAAFTLGISGLRRIFGQYMARAAEAKREGLVHPVTGEAVKDYWYLFYIATEEQERNQGLGGELIRRFLRDEGRREGWRGEGRGEGGKGDGVPVWLESTTEGSCRLYKRLGFRVVREWRLGVGEVDEMGLQDRSGKGVRVWGMIWWPDEVTREEKLLGK